MVPILRSYNSILNYQFILEIFDISEANTVINPTTTVLKK